jgi:hypothetical protein
MPDQPKTATKPTNVDFEAKKASGKVVAIARVGQMEIYASAETTPAERAKAIAGTPAHGELRFGAEKVTIEAPVFADDQFANQPE